MIKRLILPILLFYSTSTTAAELIPVEIKGAPEALADNIKAFLTLPRQPCTTDRKLVQHLLRSVDKEIKSAGHALGYYNLSFTRNRPQADSCWKLILNIQPGPRTVVDKMTVTILGQAKSEPRIKAYLKQLPLKPGNPLHHGRYEKIKTDLSGLAAELGYFDARFQTARVSVNPQTNKAGVSIVFDSGQRYRLGPVTFRQNILADSFMQRFLTFSPGDYYDSSLLTNLERALYDSRYFEQANVNHNLEDAQDHQLPVEVTLTPRKRHAYSAGLGVVTDTGPRVTLGYENRYLNQQGHRLNNEWILSPVQSSVRLDYTIPLQDPVRESLAFYTSYATEDTDSSQSDTFTLGANYATVLENNWLQTYFINFEQTSFEVGDTPDSTSLLIPGISWSRTSFSAPIYPLKGWRMQLKLRGSSQTLGSDASFAQISTGAKWIRKIGPGRLLARIDGGLSGISNIEALPPSVRFFAGGDKSVRGYAFKSLGPEDSTGEVIGGAHLIVGSVEYDYRFKPNWVAAVFFDQGNAFNQSDFVMKQSAGIGLRWLSVLGAIRLDLAKAQDDEQAFRIHVSMGPDL